MQLLDELVGLDHRYELGGRLQRHGDAGLLGEIRDAFAGLDKERMDAIAA